MGYLSKTIEQLLILAKSKKSKVVDESLIRLALKKSSFSPDLAFRPRNAA